MTRHGTMTVPFSQLPQSFADFPGWETVSKSKTLFAPTSNDTQRQYIATFSMFIRASDQTSIPYGLELYRVERLPNGKKRKEFLAAFRHPQHTEEFKKQKEELRKQEKAAIKAAVDELIAARRRKYFAAAKKLVAECFRDETHCKDGGRTVKHIVWYQNIDIQRTCRFVMAHGHFHSFDDGATWVGTTSGVRMELDYAGAEAVELMSHGIKQHITTGVRVCLPTIKHGLVEFIIDPKTLIDMPSEMSDVVDPVTVDMIIFHTPDRRRWLVYNCSPQVHIPAGKMPLILHTSTFSAYY